MAVESFELRSEARVGDELRMTVRTVAVLGEFSVLESEVFRGGEALAAGQLKIYIHGPDAAGAILESNRV